MEQVNLWWCLYAPMHPQRHGISPERYPTASAGCFILFTTYDYELCIFAIDSKLLTSRLNLFREFNVEIYTSRRRWGRELRGKTFLKCWKQTEVIDELLQLVMRIFERNKQTMLWLRPKLAATRHLVEWMPRFHLLCSLVWCCMQGVCL